MRSIELNRQVRANYMPYSVPLIDRGWATEIVRALDQAFTEAPPAIAASLQLSLMDMHRHPGCPRAADWIAGVETPSYRRVPLQACESGRYEALLIGWPPGFATAIHDHHGRQGFELVLDGSLQIETYVIQADPQLQMLAVNSFILQPGRADYFGGASHAHRCRNPSATDGALSLHVYSQPVRQYQSYQHDASGSWSRTTRHPEAEGPAQWIDSPVVSLKAIR